MEIWAGKVMEVIESFQRLSVKPCMIKVNSTGNL